MVTENSQRHTTYLLVILCLGSEEIVRLLHGDENFNIKLQAVVVTASAICTNVPTCWLLVSPVPLKFIDHGAQKTQYYSRIIQLHHHHTTNRQQGNEKRSAIAQQLVRTSIKVRYTTGPWCESQES
ncbi:hypothetical protein CBL_04282 [Carabus blaptoides fortunei]